MWFPEVLGSFEVDFRNISKGFQGISRHFRDYRRLSMEL